VVDGEASLGTAPLDRPRSPGQGMWGAVAGTTIAILAIQALSLLSGVLIARALGPDGRGALASAMLVHGLTTGVALLGADVALGRGVGRQRFSVAQARGMALMLSLVSGTFATLVCGVLYWLALPAEKQALLPIVMVMGAAVIPSLLTVMLQSVLLAKGEVRRFNAVRVLFCVFYLVGTGALVLSGSHDELHYAICFFISAVATAAVAAAFTGGRDRVDESGPSPSDAAAVLRDGIPFAPTVLAQAALAHLPVLLATLAFPDRLVGLLAVALSAAGVHSALGTAVSKILFSSLTRMKETRESSEWLGRQLRLSHLAYLVIALLLVGAMPILVRVVFGQQYREAGPLASLLVVGTAVFALAASFEEPLKARGKAAQILMSQAAAILAFAGVFWLSRPAGIYSAAIAMVCAALVHYFLLQGGIRRTFALGFADCALATRDEIRLAARELARLLRGGKAGGR
jgi:O-antigen/teichoic acid export membrane protein